MRVRASLLASFVLSMAACGGSDFETAGQSGAAAQAGAAGEAGASSDAGGAGGASGGAGGAAGTAGTAGTSGDDAGTLTAEQACFDYVSQYCDRLNTCAPIFLKLYYDDVEDCRVRLTDPCVKALALPDTTKSPAWTGSCAEAISVTSCEALLVRNVPPECVPPPGPRAAGATCGEDGQCATSYCQYNYHEGCGTCLQRAGEGETCASHDDCVFGMGCALDLKCAPFGALGGPCDANQPCKPGLSCVGAGVNVKGICQTAGLGGDPCDAYEQKLPTCNLLNGFFCNVLSNLCQELTLAKGGDPCGVVGNGYAICTGSSVCKLTTQYSGNCLAAAGLGEACDMQNGPQCKPLDQCLSSVCTEPEPSLCK